MVKIVYTIGYAGRSFEDFINTLRLFGVKRVVDVRRFTKSIKQPLFSYDSLSRLLPTNGFDYWWIPELGGFRRFNVDVEDYGIANCFESSGFRAYATYITVKPEVKPFLDKLVELVGGETSVVMCVEVNPGACHRKILSDYLVSRGFRVIHIIGENRVYEHKLHSCAQIVNGVLRYV